MPAMLGMLGMPGMPAPVLWVHCEVQFRSISCWSCNVDSVAFRKLSSIWSNIVPAPAHLGLADPRAGLHPYDRGRQDRPGKTGSREPLRTGSDPILDQGAVSCQEKMLQLQKTT